MITAREAKHMVAMSEQHIIENDLKDVEEAIIECANKGINHVQVKNLRAEEVKLLEFNGFKVKLIPFAMRKLLSEDENFEIFWE